MTKTSLKLSHKRHLAPNFQNKQHNYAQKNKNVDENIQKTNAQIEKIKENKCVKQKNKFENKNIKIARNIIVK